MDGSTLKGRSNNFGPSRRARPAHQFASTSVGNGEVVLLDTERLTYHSLNAFAYAVWQRCNGIDSAAEIARLLRFDGIQPVAEAVELAIIELDEAGLLEPLSAPRGATIDRRRILQVAVAATAGAGLLPVVASITAPSPVAAESAAFCAPSSIPCTPGGGECGPFCEEQSLAGVCNVLADEDPLNGGCCECIPPP